MTSSSTHFSPFGFLLEEETIVKSKWQIQSFIAKGGKGDVYLARQLNLNRQMALKIMSQEFTRSLEGGRGRDHRRDKAVSPGGGDHGRATPSEHPQGP